METLSKIRLLIEGMGFERPWALYGLLVVIPLIVVYILLSKRMRVNVTFSNILWKGSTGRTFRYRLRHFPFALRVMAVILLICAFAGPYSTYSWERRSKMGIDIMIALDVSGSMLAEDFKPNRIEAAKQEAIKFIKGRPDDRIGIVIFGGEAFTQCPLTHDHHALISLIEKIRHGTLEDGTAIGMGLATALARLQASQAKSKVIILISDGVNNTGEISPMDALRMAKDMGVKVYTIGIGSRGVAPYPVQTPMGIVYQNMPVEIDEELLQKIAKETGGRYFRATDNERLEEIYKEIDRLEKTKIETHQYQHKNLLFHIPALVAFVLVAVEVLLRFLFLKRPGTW